MPNSLTIKQRRVQKLEALRRSDDDDWLPTQRVYGGKPAAGVRITADTALTISTVWACCRYLSQAISVLPWTVRKPSDDDRSSTPAVRHQVQGLLYRPSVEWSSTQFRETLMWWALRKGNGFAEIERDMAGRPIGLYPIHPDRVEVLRDEDDGQLFYKVDNGNQPAGFIDFMDMFHVRGLGEGPVGLNVMAYAAESLSWAKAAQLFSASFFGGGATPAGIVTMKKPLKPEGLAKLQAKFHALYGGARGQNKTIFLDNEMEYQAITMDQNKAQFLETNQFLVDEICRWFGVPPHKVQHLMRSTFSNIEHQAIEVVQDALVPWAKRFEDEADYKFFGLNRARWFTKINMRGLLQGDTKTRLEYLRGLREIGVITADEIRELEDMSPIGTAGGGDKRTVQSQYTTLEKVGEDPPAPAPAAPAAPVEPDPEEDDEDEPAQQTTGQVADIFRALRAIEKAEEACARVI